ncbi:MAG: FYDLN acid domain-containing protein [Candidatus Nitrospinota bacterium M3_3B_026]
MTHPKYGDKYTCFECGAKFYTMRKPEPICPRCGADQRKAPKKTSSRGPKAPIVVEELESDEEIEEIDEEFPVSEDAEGFDPDEGRIIVDDVPEDEI